MLHVCQHIHTLCFVDVNAQDDELFLFFGILAKEIGEGVVEIAEGDIYVLH